MSKKLILAYPWDSPLKFNKNCSREKLISEIQGGHLFDLLRHFSNAKG